MTKAERLAFLRKRFGAKNPIPASKPAPLPVPRKKVYMPWPDIIADTKRAPEWFKQATPEPALRIAHKRKARVSPLTRIADQWQKLPPIPKNQVAYSTRLANL